MQTVEDKLQIKEEYKWYKEHEEEFSQDLHYLFKHLVIKDKIVLGAFNEYPNARKYAVEKQIFDKCLIQQCLPPKNVISISTTSSEAFPNMY